MESVLTALPAQLDELASLLAGRPEADWQRPTRCAGWTVADVVLHLAQTNDLATASAQGRFGEVVERFVASGGAAATSVDHAAALRVEQERGRGPAGVSGPDRAAERGSRCRGRPRARPHVRVRSSGRVTPAPV